ncbi:MAG: hypothetical protein AB7H88_06770 [Vicinamibacterales bacterium]
MKTDTSPSPWVTWPAAAAALVLLNASLTFANVWPTPKITWAAAFSVELAIVVLLLAVAHRWAGALARRVLPAVWVVLVFGHYLDVTAPGLYGREFNLYWDSQHLGNVTAMLARAAPAWLIAAVVVGAVAAIGAAFLLARLAFGWLASAMTSRRPRLALAAVAALVIALFGVQRAEGLAPRDDAFADPVTPAYARQARYVLATFGGGPVAPVLGASPALDVPLGRLDGADVMLVFVESYGAITYETPEVADGLRESRAALADAVAAAGRTALTAYVESPTFGGSSWLAHLSLISGVEVRDQYAYTSLMASSRDTLVTEFSRQGYRTVALMPGMRQAWPEGAFYGFDQIYGRDLLAYTGPQFGWWSIPDQYALAKIDQLEFDRPARAPLFVVFPTSTTHAPFGPVAPYLPDWSTVLDNPFDPAEVARVLADKPDLTNLRPSYTHAMAYEYTALAGYIREHAGDDLVMIVIGDHQPPAAVSGPGAPHDVPVHVITSRQDVLARLAGHGFRPGLVPARPAIGRMHTLVPVLLDAFGGPTAATDHRKRATSAGALAPQAPDVQPE